MRSLDARAPTSGQSRRPWLSLLRSYCGRSKIPSESTNVRSCSIPPSSMSVCIKHPTRLVSRVLGTLHCATLIPPSCLTSKSTERGPRRSSVQKEPRKPDLGTPLHHNAPLLAWPQLRAPAAGWQPYPSQLAQKSASPVSILSNAAAERRLHSCNPLPLLAEQPTLWRVSG